MEPSEMLERVRADGLLASGEPVVVLISGGRDSTCLLDLAVRTAGPESVSALHLNYGLREDAGLDERHCVQLCERLGVPLEVRRPDSPPKGNLQAWAREQRYGVGAELAQERGALLAAGHTATDQVETILYRLASSPSRRALLAMRGRSGRLVRPLLRFTREDTAAYCRQRGLTWHEDESNDSDEFARGRIRSELVPALRAVHPAAEENVLALAEILREEGDLLEALVDEVLHGGSEVELAQLRELPAPLRRLVVQRMADEAAGGIAPGAARRADEISALSDRGTALLEIGNGLRAVAEYGRLHLEPLGRATEQPPPVRLQIPGRVRFGSFEVSCEIAAPAREAGSLDRARLGEDLLVRSWRPGDRMAPLGLGGTKSLQDLFTARRIPRLKRATLPVVEADGEIAWVGGVATSERFKVTDETRVSARLSLRQTNPPAREARP